MEVVVILIIEVAWSPHSLYQTKQAGNAMRRFPLAQLIQVFHLTTYSEWPPTQLSFSRQGHKQTVRETVVMILASLLGSWTLLCDIWPLAIVLSPVAFCVLLYIILGLMCLRNLKEYPSDVLNCGWWSMDVGGDAQWQKHLFASDGSLMCFCVKCGCKSLLSTAVCWQTSL